MAKTEASAATKPKAKPKTKAKTKRSNAASAGTSKAAAVAPRVARKKVLVEVSEALAAELVRSKQAKVVPADTAALTKPRRKRAASQTPKQQKKDILLKFFGIWADEPHDLKRIREEQWRDLADVQS